MRFARIFLFWASFFWRAQAPCVSSGSWLMHTCSVVGFLFYFTWQNQSVLILSFFFLCWGRVNTRHAYPILPLRSLGDAPECFVTSLSIRVLCEIDLLCLVCSACSASTFLVPFSTIEFHSLSLSAPMSSTFLFKRRHHAAACAANVPVLNELVRCYQEAKESYAAAQEAAGGKPQHKSKMQQAYGKVSAQ
jgi:hypothetical protein